MSRDSRETPRVAVIGAGYWGKNLVRNFAALGALALVCDPEVGACANGVKLDEQLHCPACGHRFELGPAEYLKT